MKSEFEMYKIASMDKFFEFYAFVAKIETIFQQNLPRRPVMLTPNLWKFFRA